MIEKRELGRTGAAVSELGFGAWAIGGAGSGFGYGEVSEREARECLEAYLTAGGNHIDTARYYNRSEAVIGRLLADLDARDRVFLASKAWQHGENGIRENLETSLRELQTDCIDLYYIHVPPADPAEMNRELDAFEALRDQGKIRFIGASIKGPRVTQQTVDLCRQYIRTGRVHAIQLIYSIFRQKNREVFDEAAAAGVGLVARTVLESGFLTGKYEPGHRFERDGDHRKRWDEESLCRILETAQDLSRTAVPPEYESLAQVAIRFAMRPQAITSTIVGARTPAQTESNLHALQASPLPESLVSRLVDEFGGRTDEFNGT